MVELRVFSKKKPYNCTTRAVCYYLSLNLKYYEYFTNHLHGTIAFWDGRKSMSRAIEFHGSRRLVYLKFRELLYLVDV